MKKEPVNIIGDGMALGAGVGMPWVCIWLGFIWETQEWSILR